MSGVARSLPFDMSSYIAYDKLASMGQNWETSKDYGVSDAAFTTDLSKASVARALVHAFWGSQG